MSALLDQLCTTIGTAAALHLCREIGGVSHYIPQRAKDDHHIAQIIGPDAWRALCAEFGGTRLNLPLADNEIKRRRVGQLLDEGELSVRQIALAVGCTERFVSRLSAQRRREQDQPGLFDHVVGG